jgi:hypothetical protein
MKPLMADKESIVKKLWEQWKVAIQTPQTHQDYDYWDLENDVVVDNPIMGHTTVGKIRELKNNQAIIYDKCWRVPTEEYTDDKGKRRYKVSRTFLNCG